MVNEYRGKKIVKEQIIQKKKSVDLLPGDIVPLKGENRMVFGTHTQKDGSANIQFKDPPEGIQKPTNTKRQTIVKKMPSA